MAQITNEIGELSERIEEIKSEYADLKEGIGAAEKQKVGAKESYNRHLDQGNEEAMSDDLRTIRESNAEIENLKNRFSEFPGRVQELYKRQQEIVSIVRAERSGFEQAIEKAKDDLKTHKTQIDQCFSIHGEINELNKAVGGL